MHLLCTNYLYKIVVVLENYLKINWGKEKNKTELVSLGAGPSLQKPCWIKPGVHVVLHTAPIVTHQMIPGNHSAEAELPLQAQYIFKFLKALLLNV